MSPEEEQNSPVRPHHTYVTGHRNPDTDCIGSVVGYTELLNRKEPCRYVAARCGEVNEETSFALSLFGVEVSQYIESVEPSVADIPYLDTRSVGRELPIISKMGYRDQPQRMEGLMSRKKDFLPRFGQILRVIS